MSSSICLRDLPREQRTDIVPAQVVGEQKEPRQLHRTGAQLIEHLRQSKGKLGHAITLECGVLVITELRDAIAIESRDLRA